MTEHLYALIMAGGGGTRLWPMSRREHPKQMLKLVGDRTMFQLSVDRLLPLLPADHIYVVTATEQVAPLAAQCPELPHENFIVEPMGRGTASCIGLSAMHLQRRDPEATMVVVTADHFIKREAVFRDVLRAGQAIADDGYLVTLGIEPAFAATGYGYIRQGAHLGQSGDFAYYHAERFTEKPDAATAKAFLEEGVYAWNSGMFIWQVNTILDEIRRSMPALNTVLNNLAQALNTDVYNETLCRLWPTLHKETIDYGIMEKAKKVTVIPVDLDWSDIGAWSSVKDLHIPDENGNVLLGDTINIDSAETMVFAQGERLVVTIGVDDLIVVDTPNAILITKRDQSQRVREVVEQLRAEKRSDQL